MLLATLLKPWVCYQHAREPCLFHPPGYRKYVEIDRTKVREQGCSKFMPDRTTASFSELPYMLDNLARLDFQRYVVILELNVVLFYEISFMYLADLNQIVLDIVKAEPITLR